MSTEATTAGAPQQDLWDRLLTVAIFGGMAGLYYTAVATPLLQPLFDIAEGEHWSMLWVRATVIWITMGLVLMLARTIFSMRYRPFAAAVAEEAPLLTVIVPAYNEGAMVELAVASIAQARYPRERLEI